MLKFKSFLLLFIGFNLSYAQSDSLYILLFFPENGKIINLDKAYVFSARSYSVRYVGEFDIFSENCFISLPRNEIGSVVRLLVDNKTGSYVDVMVEDKHDTIKLVLNPFNVSENKRVLKGESTKVFIELIDYQKRFHNRLDSIYSSYDLASSENEKRNLNEMFDASILNYQTFLKSIQKRNKKVGLIAQQTPVFYRKPSQSKQEFRKLLKVNYWKNIQLTSEIVENTFLLNNYLEQFVGFYFDEEVSTATQESLLYEAVDIIMDLPLNKDAYKVAYDFLMQGFKAVELQSLVTYLIGNYEQAETCESNNAHQVFQRGRGLDKEDLLPDFDLNDVFGSDKQSIYELCNDTTLLVFWSSECSYCQQVLPTTYDSMKFYGIPVIAISGDTNKDVFTKYTSFYPDWIHLSDFLSWEGKLIRTYKIVATPTFILVDSNKKIIISTSSIDRVIYNLKKQ